jgi:hypothetical protein
MADRKQTPDILGSLLGGSEEPAIIPADHNAGIPAFQHTIKPVGKPAIKKAKKKAPVKKPEPAQEETPKVKATFYISSRTVDLLEEGWTQLRKITPKEARGEVSKSLIVETALQELLADLKANGKESLLAKKAEKIRPVDHKAGRP